MHAHLTLGNQLFNPIYFKKNQIKIDFVFMREDVELCTYYKFHKHKIVFFLAAMRAYAKELEQHGYLVTYEKLLSDEYNYEESLLRFIKLKKISHVTFYEIEDKFFEKRILNFFRRHKITYQVLVSPLFLSSRSDFKDYLKKVKKPFMKSFYEWQRKRFRILIDENQKPIGGRWSFDDENRLSLPKEITPPPLLKIKNSKETLDVIRLVQDKFKNHPGDANLFWLPTDRSGAEAWFQNFLSEKLENFGPYEDAIPPDSEFVFHSLLTPFLNVGLLTPDDIVKQTLKFARKHKSPLASVEGFVRQIIGWREFVRGIYQNYSDQQEQENFWGHKRRLSGVWYTGESGIPPLDATINKVIKRGYSHHIERLMIIGSLMLLLEIDPVEAHKWFMEMYVDSSDWVMGPNVYGMALFSDGGVFATKPYICGSNYYRKMGGYKKEDWCDGVDGLYWRFIEKNKKFFLRNPRLSMMVRTVEKMDQKRKKHIYTEADKLIQKLTTHSSL